MNPPTMPETDRDAFMKVELRGGRMPSAEPFAQP